jgi:ribosomal protein L32E
MMGPWKNQQKARVREGEKTRRVTVIHIEETRYQRLEGIQWRDPGEKTLRERKTLPEPTLRAYRE